MQSSDFCWASLPANVINQVIEIALSQECRMPLYHIGQLRLVCKSWRRAIPSDGTFRSLHIWEWDVDVLEKGLAQNSAAIRLASPAQSLAAWTVISTCTKLSSLTLDYANLDSLYGLSTLKLRLKRLRVRVNFPPAEKDNPLWLSWAASLTTLQTLHVEALISTLCTEQGLSNLKSLKKLAHLTLKNCTVITDASLEVIAQLPQLKSLSALPSKFSASGVKTLGKKLIHMSSLESMHLSAASAAAALELTKNGNVTDISVHISLCQSEARDFWHENICHTVFDPRKMPQHARHIKVSQLGSTILASNIDDLDFPKDLNCQELSQQTAAKFQGVALPMLESLDLHNIAVPTSLAASYGSLTTLKSLKLRLHALNRDQSICTWTSLTGLNKLHMHITWFISDHMISKVLSAMHQMQDLQITGAQGDVMIMLQEPLEKMHSLHSLSIQSSRLLNITAMEPVLKSCKGSLSRLELKWITGAADDITVAVAGAVPELKHLRELSLWMQTPSSLSSYEVLSKSLNRSTALTCLDLGISPLYGLSSRSPVRNGTTSEQSHGHWSSISTLSRLQQLTLSSCTGWDMQSVAALCATATDLRKLTILDGQEAVRNEWIDLITTLPRLGCLELTRCRALEGDAVFGALERATALTELQAVACPVFRDVNAIENLRNALPALAKCNCYS